MLSRLALCSAAVMLTALIQTGPALSDDPVTTCDALASSPLDTARPADVVGVAFEDIDIATAEPACRAAWEATRDPRIGYQLARVLFHDDKLEEANALFAEAAAGGHVEAKIGVAQTLLELARAQAAALLTEASDAGSLNAMYNLALDYAEGTGVPQDTEKAIALYEQASDLGDAWSSYNLGVLYDEGELVLRDEDKARAYYEKAAAKDHYWAMINLGYLLLEGTPAPADHAKAAELFRRAATEGGDVNAGLQLGIMLQDGSAAEQDESQALVLAALHDRDTELGSFLQKSESGLSSRNIAAIKAEIGASSDGEGMNEADIAKLRQYYAQTP